MTARADFVLPLPDGYPDLQAAPLLCAGVIGYRALRLTEIEELDGPPRLGLYGFGASARIVAQVARHLGHDVFVCTRGERAQQLARELGARWVGGTDEPPPGGAGRGDHLRAGRAARSGRRCARCAAEARSCAPGST